MEKVRTFILFTLLIVGNSVVYATNVDSLKQLLSQASGKEKCDLYARIARYYIPVDWEQAWNHAQKARSCAEKEKDWRILSLADLYAGVLFKQRGQYDTAVYYYRDAIRYFRETKDTVTTAKAYTGLGQSLMEKGDLYLSIKYIRKAIELKKWLKDKKGEGIGYATLGNIYVRMGDNKEALKNYEKALSIFEQIGFLSGKANVLNSIGTLYDNMANYNNKEYFSEAIRYYNSALQLFTQMGDSLQMANTLLNLGVIHLQYLELVKQDSGAIRQFAEEKQEAKIKLTLALKLFQRFQDYDSQVLAYINLSAYYSTIGDLDKALSVLQEARNALKGTALSPYSRSLIYYYLADIYEKQKRYVEADSAIRQGIKISRENYLKKILAKSYLLLSKILAGERKFQQAWEVQREYIVLRDSLYNEQTGKLIQQFGVKEKERELKLKEATLRRKEAENKLQRMYIYGLAFFSVLVLLGVFMIYRQYRQKKIANMKLAEKNALILEQKQQITDSILYAKNIQEAILPPEAEIKQAIRDYFILFKPRDIVSGDFYWFYQYSPDMYAVSVSDCTGHGVPGAFMSMLGVSLLNELATGKNPPDVSLLFENLRDRIIKSLHSSAKDGMDMVFVLVDKKRHVLEFAGAMNPLFLVRKAGLPGVEVAKRSEQGGTHVLYEISGDKMAIGASWGTPQRFRSVKIPYFDGDMIYMFSDGYADQFGGEQNKKYTKKRFKKLLLSVVNEIMSRQQILLNDEIEHWKNGGEQTDDITVVGIRL